jgi:hypothetical protein
MDKRYGTSNVRSLLGSFFENNRVKLSPRFFKLLTKDRYGGKEV